MNGLKKFSSVNKKALDQYINFTEQRDELHQRREENNKAESKIKEPLPRSTPRSTMEFIDSSIHSFECSSFHIVDVHVMYERMYIAVYICMEMEIRCSTLH